MPMKPDFPVKLMRAREHIERLTSEERMHLLTNVIGGNQAEVPKAIGDYIQAVNERPAVGNDRPDGAEAIRNMVMRAEQKDSGMRDPLPPVPGRRTRVGDSSQRPIPGSGQQPRSSDGQEPPTPSNGG